MSSRRKMANTAIRHQIFLMRYSGTQTKEIIQYVKNVTASATDLLNNAGTELSRSKYKSIISSFKQLSTNLNNSMNKTISNNLDDLAAYESQYTKNMIDSSINTDKLPFEIELPAITQIRSAAFSSVMDFSADNTGLTIGDALNGFGSKIASNIVQQIRTGFTLGTPTAEIANGIEDYTGSNLISSQANTIARTVTNYLASSAREEVYKENSDIINAYQIIATLDDRTSFECMARDGETQDIDAADLPPYHYNCRTTYIGVVDPQYSISFPDATRPAKGSDDDENSTPATSTYNSWLQNQSEAFQNEVLGPARAELFRGGASVQSFVDNNYQPYTLDQLKAKDSEHD